LGALSRGKAESMEYLFNLWLLANPSAEQAATDLAAIKRGIAEADAGKAIPIEQAFSEVRQALREQA